MLVDTVLEFMVSLGNSFRFKLKVVIFLLNLLRDFAWDLFCSVQIYLRRTNDTTDE